MTNLIQIEGLSKSFREGEQIHLVLDDVTADINRGELIVIIGRSGSGKSTLLNLLGGIDRPDSGTIKIGQVDLDALNERDRTLFRRDHIGYVFQFFNLIPTLTVMENLLLPLELQGSVGKPERDRCRSLLEEVGLYGRRSSFPERLSGGERQRVAIARALVHQPDLILADEPTGNLDVGTGVQVIELLDRLTRQSGKTLLMATHSHEVVGLSDRTLSIEHGKLVELTPEVRR